VYATCSILPEENDAIVSDFLSAHPAFRLRPAHEELAANRIELPRPAGEGDPLLRLSPHIHGTDGFFAAWLERAA
jgi:16S rRNA (cytosine967-C5)-methyltransferase